MVESSCPTSLLWISQLFDHRSHHHGEESSRGSRGGSGLAWPQLYSRPQQEMLSPSGTTMVPLGHSVTSSPTPDLSGLVPQAWVPQASLSGIPGHSGQAQIVCTPRQSQYSPRAKGARVHTHTCTHTQSADVCVLMCTPASPRDRSPLPMLQQACKAHTLLLDPLGSRPWQPCPCGPPYPSPTSQDPKALAQTASMAEKVFWALPSLSPGAQMPGSSSCHPLSSPH